MQFFKASEAKVCPVGEYRKMHSVIEMKRVYPLGSMNVLANFMVFFSIGFCDILSAMLACRPEVGTTGKFMERPKEKGSYSENYEYPLTFV